MWGQMWSGLGVHGTARGGGDECPCSGWDVWLLHVTFTHLRLLLLL